MIKRLAAVLAELVQARPDYSKYAVGWAVFIDIPNHQGRQNIHRADAQP
jgi:hypothetical protein